MTGIVKSLIIILTIAAAWNQVQATEDVGNDRVIAVINGRTVYYSELLRQMNRLRWSVVDVEPNGETARQYWLQQDRDSSRLQRLYHRAVFALKAQKVQEQLLADHGLWPYADDRALQRHLDKVNKERAEQKREHHVIYGPDRYNLQTFYEYQTNNALIRLKEILVENKTLPITHEDLHNQFAEMKRGPYAKEKFTFDAYRRQIRAAYIEQAYHRWFWHRVNDAKVKTEHLPTIGELYAHFGNDTSAAEATKEDAMRGVTYYVDSFNGDDRNDGRHSGRAWKTLRAVNEVTFHPGDRILFRRGGIWFGQLHPKGCGSPDAYLSIGSYGRGPKPLFHGGGLQGEGVVYLYNQSYWQIEDLEVVNPGDSEGDRRGVEIRAENIGVIRGLYIRNLHVHHVTGIRGHDYASKKTGGIYIAVRDDRNVPTRFDDVRVSDCLLHDLSNQGIVTNNERNHKDYPGTPEWHHQKFTNVCIRQNVLHHISKNAIIVRLAENGKVEHNLCYETALGMSGNTMFTISSQGTVFQYNEGFLNRSTDADGSLYDPDLSSPGTMWQYSYSHHNAHGLVWFCTREADSGIIVRHNISSNDYGYLIYANYAFSGAKIYGNMFYVSSGRSPVIFRENPRNRHVYEFSNNLIYNHSTGTQYELAPPDNQLQKRLFSNNLYRGIAPPPMETTSGHPIAGKQPSAPPIGYYDVASWFGLSTDDTSVSDVTVYRNLRYREKPQGVYAGDTSSDRLLDLYLPAEKVRAKTPVLVFVHGGGFAGGDKSALTGFFRGLASHGFAVISANYRLYLKHHRISGASASANMARGLPVAGKFHPALQEAISIASDDITEVLKWIRLHGHTYDLDVQRVAVSGGSAGAMTILYLTFASGQQVLPIKAVINMWGGLQDTAIIRAGAPPVLTFHGDKDQLIHVDYAFALDERLKKVGGHSELVVLPGRGHAIYNIVARDCLPTIVSFLRQTLN